jgi:excisionase family DNA binding protein
MKKEIEKKDANEEVMKSGYAEDLKKALLDRELNRMLTITEAAELLGVSCTSLRRYANEGKIKVYRVGSGKHRRFRKRDVLAYLEMNSEF